MVNLNRLSWLVLVLVLFPFRADSCPDWSKPAPLAFRSLLLDGSADQSHYVAVGERGHILTAQGDGLTWAQSRVPTCVLLTSVHFQNRDLGWAVGHDAIILRTLDGGKNWTVIHNAPELEIPILDITFMNERDGYAVGAYGYFLETKDGGENWTERLISEEDDYHLNKINFAGNNRMYMAAEAGVLYRSDDNGKNWYSLESPYFGSWFAVHTLSPDDVLVAGLRGNLYRSEDGGHSWIKVDTNTRALLTDFVQLPSGKLIVTGMEGTILVSENQGRSFSDQSLDSRKGIMTALPVDDDNILLIGEFGVQKWSLSQ